MNRWRYYWRLLQSQIWFRASLYAAFGVAAALVAVVVAPLVPQEVANRLGGTSVDSILTILASSLLAVATFSLGAWVSAYTSVSQSASPRVAALVIADEPTQRALSTFVGAFLYAIVALSAVQADIYGPQGRAVIYLTSLLIVGLVAFRLLAWINRLASLARLSHMIELLERTTAEWLQLQPPSPTPDPVAGQEVGCPVSGYVENIDLEALQGLAEGAGCRIEILAPVGSYRRRGEPIARIGLASLSDGLASELQSAFVIAAKRSFDQDPRYGLIVLAEIGERALSPAINDPGTAIQIAGVAVRLLDDWGRMTPDDATAPIQDRVVRPGLEPEVLLTDVFLPLIRYGMGDLAVAIRVQKGLRSLAGSATPVATPAGKLADEAAQRARAALPKEDRARFEAAFSGQR